MSSSRSDEHRRAEYDRGVRRGRLFTPLTFSYRQMLPLIQAVEGFRCPQPMRSDPNMSRKTSPGSAWEAPVDAVEQSST
ncbi:hypothetical protein CK203_019846 [Vitis vinifera]|uniref:Uncharacterized protein n=1 Tax=Vitis vinifera TaxID=29760 RepID=A0A438J2X9_VITVI|nr:hypothetical protein CK203_019846 [Vitis vinifera]